MQAEETEAKTTWAGRRHERFTLLARGEEKLRELVRGRQASDVASLARQGWTKLVGLVRSTTPSSLADHLREALGEPLIVMPESALPDLANNLVPYLGRLYSEASARGSALVLGLVRASDDGSNYFNSVAALGAEGVGWYDKHHLVPFAEFFPVPKFVRRYADLHGVAAGAIRRWADDVRSGDFPSSEETYG